MDPTNKAIWRKFRIRINDVLPFHARVGGRLELADLFNDLGFTNGVEVGTENGRFALELCKRITGLKLKCVDPYDGRYYQHTDEDMERAYQTAQKRVEGYDVTFLRRPSIDAAKLFPDDSLDFVYIDAMHYFDDCVQDIIAWHPKVKRGGIVAGHDYRRRYGYGVIDAVDAFARTHNITQYYITNELVDPSWLWVR